MCAVKTRRSACLFKGVVMSEFRMKIVQSMAGLHYVVVVGHEPIASFYSFAEAEDLIANLRAAVKVAVADASKY